ncbi:MAG: prepilin-type N-terminal cleavage/methylation domain-containing protein [Gammaproteobacteria bacterium]|nr:prepilin-type N-terminal cleavage/methylation domain-containing protein [Gammaproteobacteria bacterium]
MKHQNTTRYFLCRGRLSKTSGFTLVELMITVAIVGIIAAIAVPSYQSSVNKSRRSDCMGTLTSFANAMERHATSNNGSYKGAGAGGGDTGAPTIFSTQAPIDGSNKSCNLTIDKATPSTYTLRATPINALASSGEGIIELDSTGARRWDHDGNGNFGATDNCWETTC